MPYTRKLEGRWPGLPNIMLIGIEAGSARLARCVPRSAARRAGRMVANVGEEAALMIYRANLRMECDLQDDPSPPKGTASPREVGIRFVPTASTSPLATRIAKAAIRILSFPLVRGKIFRATAFLCRRSENRAWSRLGVCSSDQSSPLTTRVSCTTEWVNTRE